MRRIICGPIAFLMLIFGAPAFAASSWTEYNIYKLNVCSYFNPCHYKLKIVHGFGVQDDGDGLRINSIRFNTLQRCDRYEGYKRNPITGIRGPFITKIHVSVLTKAFPNLPIAGRDIRNVDSCDELIRFRLAGPDKGNIIVVASMHLRFNNSPDEDITIKNSLCRNDTC